MDHHKKGIVKRSSSSNSSNEPQALYLLLHVERILIINNKQHMGNNKPQPFLIQKLLVTSGTPLNDIAISDLCRTHREQKGPKTATHLWDGEENSLAIGMSTLVAVVAAACIPVRIWSEELRYSTCKVLVGLLLLGLQSPIGDHTVHESAPYILMVPAC